MSKKKGVTKKGVAGKKNNRPFKVGWDSRGSTVWIGGRFQLAEELIDGQGASKVLLWAELPGLQLLGMTHVDRKNPQSLGDALVEVMEDPSLADTSRPACIRVATQELAAEVRLAVGTSIPISIELTPELDQVFELLEGEMLEAQEETDTTFSKAELLLDVLADMRDEDVWSVLPERESFRVDIPGRGIHGACMSILGSPFGGTGFLIFPSADAFEAFVNLVTSIQAKKGKDGQFDFGSSWLSLTFEPQDGVLPSALVEANRESQLWPLDQEFPVLRRFLRSGDVVPISEEDVEFARACAQSLVALNRRNGPEMGRLREDEIEPISVTVLFEPDEELHLTIPYEAYEFFKSGVTDTSPHFPEKSFKARVGRNAPCPCGSGKKYKKCHLPLDREAASAETPHQRDWRLVRDLNDFASEFLDSDYEDRIEEFISLEELPQMAMPWSVYVTLVREKTVVQWYLDSGVDLDKRDRVWLEAQCDSWVSVWEVTDRQAGISVSVRDHLTGIICVVHDELASDAMSLGQFILGRVVDFEERSLFVGVFPIPLPPDMGEEIVSRMRKRLRRKSDVPIERMQEYKHASYLMGNWEEAAVELARQSSSRMANSEGDLLLLTLDRFTFSSKDQEDVRLGIESLSGVTRDDYAEGILLSRLESEVAPSPMGGTAREESLARDKELASEDDATFVILAPRAEDTSAGQTLLATLLLRYNEVLVETNSTERGDRFRTALESVCKEWISFEGREQSTIEEAHEGETLSGNRPKSKGGAGSDGEVPTIPPEEMHRIALSFKREHYSGWPDVSLPALGGKTPRESVKDPEGRKLVDDLLREMEQHEKRENPEAAYDFREVRRSLGFAR